MGNFFFESPLLWGFISLIFGALALSGRFSVNAARICLVIAGLVAVVGIVRWNIITRLTRKLYILILIICLSVVTVALYPLYLWVDKTNIDVKQYTPEEIAAEVVRKMPLPTPIKPTNKKDVVSKPYEHIGPRIEFAGLKVEHNGGYSIPIMQAHNTSEIAVSSYQLIGSIFLSDYENNLENKDVNNIVNDMEEAVKKILLVPSDQLQITRGMGLQLKLQQHFSDNDIASVNDGSKKMYVVMLAVYITPKTPKNKMWVTEVCARVTKPFTEFQSCPAHNRFFFSDKALNKIE